MTAPPERVLVDGELVAREPVAERVLEPLTDRAGDSCCQEARHDDRADAGKSRTSLPLTWGGVPGA